MSKTNLLNIELEQACTLLKIALSNKNAVLRYENSKKNKWNYKRGKKYGKDINTSFIVNVENCTSFTVNFI